MIALHVTALENLGSILNKGLIVQTGPLASAIESVDAVYVFPYWDAMLDANWLYENWPYESEPILLSVDISDVHPHNICADNKSELVLYQDVPAHCIKVLAPSEENWTEFLQAYLDGGGKRTQDEIDFNSFGNASQPSP